MFTALFFSRLPFWVFGGFTEFRIFKIFLLKAPLGFWWRHHWICRSLQIVWTFNQYCGSDHELLIAKCRLKLKKVEKTTRPCRYDLNQFPYDYTLEVRNRFKGLDLIDRVPDKLWMEVCDVVQETGIKTTPKKKKCKKTKWLPEEALQIAVKKEVKSKAEKDISIWMQSSKE